MSLELRAQCNSINFGTWELYGRDRFAIPGKIAVVESLQLTAIEKFSCVPRFAYVKEAEMQQLMDDL